MSLPSSSVSAASKMIRPVQLFLSTEDAEEYSDASRVAITLRDQLMAQDGFKLVYGLRSFGYNTNVMNVSQAQRNNVLRIQVTYLTPLKQYDSVSQAIINFPNANTQSIKTHDILLSDGNYNTLTSLFSALNEQIKLQVDSGWLKNYLLPEANQIPQNRTSFGFQFNVVDNRYITLSLKAVDMNVMNGYVDDNDIEIAAWDFAHKIVRFEILPHPEKPELYNQLFFNEISTRDRPISLPSYVNGTGYNPPDGIAFVINATSYKSYNTGGADHTVGGDNFELSSSNVWETVVWDIVELGNEHIVDTANDIYPNEVQIYQNLDYVGYHVPFIHPFYLDISTSLENANVTSTGEHKNLLHRQFVVGAKDGASSFFQNWESPIYHILDSKYISTLEIKFESQMNRWNFFNMEYAVELIIFEIEDDSYTPDFVEPAFVMPGEDALTTQVRQYTNSIQNPYPILGSGQQRKAVVFNDILKRRVKSKYS